MFGAIFVWVRRWAWSWAYSGFGRSVLKSEHDIVLRKFCNLRQYENRVKARLEHGIWARSTEYGFVISGPGFGRSVLKSEYDTVFRKFGDLRWVWARCENEAWAWNLSTEYWVRFYNLGPWTLSGHSVFNIRLVDWSCVCINIPSSIRLCWKNFIGYRARNVFVWSFTFSASTRQADHFAQGEPNSLKDLKQNARLETRVFPLLLRTYGTDYFFSTVCERF